MRAGALSHIQRAAILSTLGAFLTLGPAMAADQSLIDAAKKEGRVTWYTNHIIEDFGRPAAEAFEKKYGIHVDAIRAGNAEISLRVMNEGAAGKLQADVIDGTAATKTLQKAGFIQKWLPDAAARFDKQFVDPDGYWISTNLYAMTPGYNTKLIPKGTEPRSDADLLDPKWKGKIVWSSPASTYEAAEFIGFILTYMGEEKGRAYLQQLAKQNIAEIGGSARNVLDQVIQGEYPLALMMFNYQTVISAEKGAPIDWIPMQPTLGTLSLIAVTQGGPHPNAGKLLVDYLTSPEGQRLFRDRGFLPVDPDVAPTHPELRPDGVNFKALYMSPDEIESSQPYWIKVYNQYFR